MLGHRWVGAVVGVGLALGTQGCSKDAEVNEFLELKTSLAGDIEKAYKGAKEGDADAAAEKVFDAKKGDLQKKYDAIKEARGFQIKDDTKKKLEETVAANMLKVCELGSKKLCDDFMNVVK